MQTIDQYTAHVMAHVQPHRLDWVATVTWRTVPELITEQYDDGATVDETVQYVDDTYVAHCN